MKLLDKLIEKLKNSRMGAFFRTAMGRKALPEQIEEKIEETIEKIDEKTAHEKFVEKLSKDTHDISRMSETEMIVNILGELGVKKDLLKNQDAIYHIEKIAIEEIKGIERIQENFEEIKSKLSGIVTNVSSIKKISKISENDNVHTIGKEISLDQEGRVVICETTGHSQNYDQYIKLKKDGRTAEEALQESGYEENLEHKFTVLEEGLEVEKRHIFIKNPGNRESFKRNTVDIVRNPDGFSANVKVTNNLTGETREVNNRWADINADAYGVNSHIASNLLTGVNEGEINIVETDIEKIDLAKNDNEWCNGLMPEWVLENLREQQESFIEMYPNTALSKFIKKNLGIEQEKTQEEEQEIE